MRPTTWPVVPPIDVSDWDQVAAYETAAQCQKAQDKMLSEASEVARNDKGGTDPARLYQTDLALRSANVRCVPSEHIYPPKKCAP